MTGAEKSPILIVGAGVTGLMLGCVLARHEVPFRIIDKLAAARPQARATTVHSRTLEVLQDFGVVEALIVEAVKVAAINQVIEGRSAFRAEYSAVDAPFPFMLSIEQWKTENLLEARLRELGGTVERRTELVAIEERLDGVRATLRRPDGTLERADASWLVACDGAHSTVRHLNRQGFPGDADPRRFVAGDVVTEAPYPRDEVTIFIGEAGYLGWFPLPDQRSLLVANYDVNPDRNAAPPTLDQFKALVDARSPQKCEVSEPRWLGWFWTNYRLTPHYRHGRTLLAGDAAHIHSPTGGQGMNTGIQDAYNLGWKLALVSQGRAPESLIDSYEKERRAVAEDVIAATRARAEHDLSFGSYPAAERERLYPHVHVPEVERLKVLTQLEELDLDYRKSPICVETRHGSEPREPETGGPRAGAEAVDAKPLEVDGARVSLFNVLSGPRHTLLLFTDADGDHRRHADTIGLATEVGRVYGDLIQVCLIVPAGADLQSFDGGPGRLIHDVEGAMHRRYAGSSGSCYLIRPDGYIGWRSDRPALTALRDYLARVLICP